MIRLQDLTDAQQAVLTLRLAGLTSSEISEVLGRGIDAVKMLQFRAIKQLRRSMNSRQEDERA